MIYVILADGFEDIEALEPIDIMRRAGLDVKTAALNGKTARSAHGATVCADINICDIDKGNMQMLVLPGGAGHVLLDKSEAVDSLINYAHENDIYISAICASPSLLGKRGLLKGKKYICFPGFEQYCTDGILTDKQAVLDGKILTAKGAGAAADFGFEIVTLFCGEKTACDLRKQMQYKF